MLGFNWFRAKADTASESGVDSIFAYYGLSGYLRGSVVLCREQEDLAEWELRN